VRDLPPDLIAAFRATLEEVQEAALILQVSDISSQHHAEQDAEVVKVLKELGVEDRPRLLVLNKTDRLAPEELSAIQNANSQHERTIFTSAMTGAGLDELLARIDEVMPVDPLMTVKLRMPMSDGRNISLIQARGRVLRSEVDNEHFIVEAEIPQSLARKLGQFVVPDAPATPKN
jgi:GTP-binding protein HflX